MEKSIISYENIRKQLKAYDYALTIISWDSSTEAPKGCFEDRSKMIGALSEMAYRLETSEEFVSSVETLHNNLDKLDKRLAHEIIEVKKGIDKTRKIPMDEYIEFSILMGSSQEVWAEAKKKSDYSIFKPTLEKIINFKRKQIKYLETEELKGYDILLDYYEPGFTTKEYDLFFDVLKEKLVPFFKKINQMKLKYNDSFTKKLFPKQKQIEFCEYIQDVVCFDRNHGLMKESEHPFTTGMGTTDVRFTNHYYEEDVASAIFSAIHELGHAIYNQQNDPALNDTLSSGGASLGIHESQSRMLENMIGRSKAFWETHFSKLLELFPEQLQGITVDDFYKHINRSEASYIRMDADELSYPLHIMLRYDIEKGLFNGEYEVEDLNKVWNHLFKEYFGIEVKTDREGILQDMHWGGGLIGYFPTYALGSAYAAQIYHYMDQDINIDEEIRTGKTTKINAWLKEKVHFFGSSLYPKGIIEIATNEEFNPHYYIDYLINKYKDIYDIK